MTFYEAAVQILLRTGHPLHAREIAEIAIKENLLSHVGKEPEVTMASRLAAMARRSHDKRLVAVEPDTFALTDWSVPAAADALELSGLPEVHDETEPALRSRERHPRVDKENVRIAGRGDRRRKHEEVERKRKKKRSPVADLVLDLLGRVGEPLPLFDLAAAAREKELVADDLGREGLASLLTAENENREEMGRKPLFAFHDEGFVGLHAGPAPSGEARDFPALVAKALASIEERKAVPAPAAVPAGALEQAAEEQRLRATKQLRKRLAELDAAGLEAVASAMFDSMGYVEVRVAKRHKEGALFLMRRRMGLTEVRFAIRVIKGGREVRREEVVELRKDMASHGAQMGVIVSPSDPTREARNEAASANASLVTLLCADALADQLAVAGLGVRKRVIETVDFDESGLRALVRRAPAAPRAEAAGEAAKPSATAEERRERRERERQEWRDRREKAREDRRRARAEADAKAKEAAAAQAEGAPEAKAAAEPVAEREAEAAAAEPVKKGEEAGAAAEGVSEAKAEAEETEAAVEPAAETEAAREAEKAVTSAAEPEGASEPHGEEVSTSIAEPEPAPEAKADEARSSESSAASDEPSAATDEPAPHLESPRADDTVHDSELGTEGRRSSGDA
ncbi:HTH domain-containing protein [Vulgatibacter incomptus]|uniref:TolA protein n=1 Tax=Vulgatibacter incomptus TaxID=1391653 RepID=A0A0K1PBH8_9BACT|nr:HTH domain-containing protein [Vulgatibacter incomptus]AKU90893.1 TolA protein [Vulgatibacter incomptus]